MLFGLYLLSSVIGIFNDKFILFIIMNFIIFDAVMNQYCQFCSFKILISFKQVYEGIIGIIECLIPRYKEPKDDKKNKNKPKEDK